MEKTVFLKGKNDTGERDNMSRALERFARNKKWAVYSSFESS